MRIDVTPFLQPERDALVELLADLTEAEWAAPTECPAWTVKALALHVLGDDLSLLSRQRDASGNGLVLFAETHPGLSFRELLDGFNEQWVTAALFLSPDLIVEQLRLTGEWSARFYDEVDSELLSEPVGFFGATGPSPYWQVAAREYVERFIHQSQIRRALGRAEIGAPLIAPAAASVVRAFAAHLQASCPTGRSVLLRFEGVDAWTLLRRDNGWDVQAAARDGDAVLDVDAPTVVPFLSRGLDTPTARHAIAVAGDVALGRAVADGIAAIATIS
jgi:uncharacterized protein (TIGR03083 family)